MRHLGWLAFTLCACTATPAAAPLVLQQVQPRPITSQRTAAESREDQVPLATLVQQLAPLLQPSALKGVGEGWLDGRTTLRPLAPRCWKLQREREQGERGERVTVLQHHGLGPNELICASGPVDLTEVATLFAESPGAPLTWQSPSGNATLAELVTERNRVLLRAVARLRARLEEAGVAWDDTVRFRVDGEAQSFVDVTVVDVGNGRDIATFRVERATGGLTFIHQGEHGAEVRPLASFEREWFAAHPPAITALEQALDLDWSGCRTFRVEAEHGSYFDVAAELSEECAQGGPKDPQHFRVDLRSGTLTWKSDQRYLPLTKLQRRVDQQSARAAKLFKRWLGNNPHYKQLECPGILPSGVSGSNVSIRLHVAPPCNQSPMLMTIGWFNVNVQTGRISCDGPCP